MIIFHLIVYVFFKDTTYLLLVINLFFTLLYLLLLKHYHEDFPFPGSWLSAMRYLLNPMGVLVCATSLLFAQSFLNTRGQDILMHRVTNAVLLFFVLAIVTTAVLQLLWLVEIVAIYLGVSTFLLVIVTSIRGLMRGNAMAWYPFVVFFGFVVTIMLFFFPLSFSDFRSNETDYHYYAEAFRAVVFAVGVADRFRRVRQGAVKAELEKNQIALAREQQLQAQKDRIRRDLHDSLGSQLSFISIGLNQLINDQRTSTIRMMQALADKAIAELRDSLWIMNKEFIS